MKIFITVLRRELGPLSLVRTFQELLDRKVADLIKEVDINESNGAYIMLIIFLEARRVYLIGVAVLEL